MNVRENVAFPLRERGGLAEDQVVQLVDRLIGLVGAEDVVDSFPSSLSTGRKRAVAIARALAAQPEIVLYDEPTTMVDPTSTASPSVTSPIVRRLEPFHSFSAIPHSVLKMMMLAMCRVQLENLLYFPIWVSPIV